MLSLAFAPVAAMVTWVVPVGVGWKGFPPHPARPSMSVKSSRSRSAGAMRRRFQPNMRRFQPKMGFQPINRDRMLPGAQKIRASAVPWGFPGRNAPVAPLGEMVWMVRWADAGALLPSRETAAGEKAQVEFAGRPEQENATVPW